MCHRPKRYTPPRRRSGFTLLELLVASASATVLTVGLGGSIFIASLAYDDSDNESSRRMDAIFAADEILADLQLAKKFRQRTATSVEFMVPDRDGDGIDEVIRYAWSGVSGDPLTREYNGLPPGAILPAVASLNLEYYTRNLPATESPVIFEPLVVFEGFMETKVNEKSGSISIAKPPGVDEDELLVAVVAADKNQVAQFEQSVPGWNFLLAKSRDSNISLGVWWRLATNSEPSEYTFKIDQGLGAYGWVMHFSGNDANSPIDAFDADTGRSKRPQTPSIKPSTDNALVLRVGAFDDNSVREDEPNVANAEVITLDSVAAASGGAVYEQQKTSADSDQSSFELRSREDYVTATIAIKPAREVQ